MTSTGRFAASAPRTRSTACAAEVATASSATGPPTRIVVSSAKVTVTSGSVMTSDQRQVSGRNRRGTKVTGGWWRGDPLRWVPTTRYRG
ncbi:hypothetical protein GCM10009558_081110 [Virgisporangium aurantiacum]